MNVLTLSFNCAYSVLSQALILSIILFSSSGGVFISLCFKIFLSSSESSLPPVKSVIAVSIFASKYSFKEL